MEKNAEVLRRIDEINKIFESLTKEERDSAAWDFACLKWNSAKNAEYWQAKEAEKTGKAHF